MASSLTATNNAKTAMASQPQSQRKHVEFSTRFLPSDGIPSYNALLDTQLGKRREFLLGNKHSLQHLQRTGVISRVEEMAENPSQYVVIMHEKKQPPPTLTSCASSESLRRPPSLNHDLYGLSSRDADKTHAAIKRSESTPLLPAPSSSSSSSSFTANRRRRRPQQQNQRRDEDEESDDEDDAEDDRAAFVPSRHAGAGSATNPSTPSSLIDRLRRRRRASQEEPARVDSLAKPSRLGSTKKPPLAAATTTPTTQASSSTTTKPRSVVERLLESDAAYQLKLQILRDEMRVLEKEKRFFDTQITKMRKQLKGVNAVHENDVAVAHCAAIMHARIAKAEEEYMKLVTAQQQIKTEIDTLRRELLAMRKVHKKLADDIADVQHANAAVEDKVRASKSVRNVLSQELLELERRAEIEAEEQRLKLPPEDDVVVDAQELMSAVQLQSHGRAGQGRRRSTVVLTAGSPLENLQRMLSDKVVVAEVTSSDKPLLSFRSAFRVIQQTLQATRHDEDHHNESNNDAAAHTEEDLEAFVRTFEATENALLSKHSLNVQLQEEVDQLEREAAALQHDARERHASIRGTMHVATAMHQQLQDTIYATLRKIDSYNELRDVRNHEHTRLRAIMQRCLEILHAEKLVSSEKSLSGPLLLSELSSPAMLEALQKKMTEVAITLKLKHHTSSKADDDGASGVSETVKTAPRSRPQSGGNQRRSNLLAKRDTPASKILLGPREPSGAALTAILITAQPPTVEGAEVLTETQSHAKAMHALHPSIMGPIVAAAEAAAAAKSQRRPTISRMGSIRAGTRRVSSLGASGSLRRISAPVSSTTSTSTAEGAPGGGGAMVAAGGGRPARASMVVWPLRKSDTTDSLIQPEDAHARVIESTDELDE